jgi:hypothetical protein
MCLFQTCKGNRHRNRRLAPRRHPDDPFHRRRFTARLGPSGDTRHLLCLEVVLTLTSASGDRSRRGRGISARSSGKSSRRGISMGWRGRSLQYRPSIVRPTVRGVGDRPRTISHEVRAAVDLWRSGGRCGRCGRSCPAAFWLGRDPDGPGPCATFAPERDLDAELAQERCGAPQPVCQRPEGYPTRSWTWRRARPPPRPGRSEGPRRFPSTPYASP